MVEKLDGLRVEGEVPKVLVVEEMNSMGVEFEGESLEEGDVVSKNFFIREIQFENNDRVYVIIGQEIVCGERERERERDKTNTIQLYMQNAMQGFFYKFWNGIGFKGREGLPLELRSLCHPNLWETLKVLTPSMQRSEVSKP